MFGIIFRSVIEFSFVVLLIIGFIYEDRVIKFEQNAWRFFKILCKNFKKEFISSK